LIVLILYSCADEKKERALHRRFDGYLTAINGMNIDSIQAYTYPKLFTILPLSQSRESLEASFDFIKGRVELNSVKIDTIFPVFRTNKGSFAKATYSMVIRVPLDTIENVKSKISVETANKEYLIEEKYPAPQSTLLAALMRNKYGIEFINYQEKNGMRIMQIRFMAIAVKDEFAKDWSFFTVTNDQELISKLFSKKVLENLTSKD